MFISSPISYTPGMLGGLIMDRWCAPEQLRLFISFDALIA